MHDDDNSGTGLSSDEVDLAQLVRLVIDLGRRLEVAEIKVDYWSEFAAERPGILRVLDERLGALESCCQPPTPTMGEMFDRLDALDARSVRALAFLDLLHG